MYRVQLYNLATCYLEMCRDDEAMCYYRETLRVERKALGNNHRDVILTLLHYGQVLQGRGEHQQALKYYREALAAQSRVGVKTGIPDYATSARILNHMGNIYLQRGEAKEMVEALSNALRQFKLAGRNEEELVVSGFNFYALAKCHPEAPPAA